MKKLVIIFFLILSLFGCQPQPKPDNTTDLTYPNRTDMTYPNDTDILITK